MPLVEKLRIETDRGDLEVCIGGGTDSTAPTVCAAHPAEPLGENAVELLSAASGTRVVCVSPGRLTLEEMVDSNKSPGT